VESLIFLALLVVSFYLLIIRPTRSRARAAADLQNQLAPGLEVMTGSGIFGRVTRVEDDVVSLEVSPGVSLRVAKPAIGRIVTDDTDPGEEPASDDPEADHRF
jgi:preprotein translocase subunit YajC